MAISSVSASRQAEGGGGAGSASSAGFPVSTGVCLVSFGLSGCLAGASAGLGFGNGTEGGRAARRSFGLRCSPNRSPHGASDQAGLLAAAAGAVGAQSITSAVTAVTILAARARPLPPQGHLRRAISALEFMAIP